MKAALWVSVFLCSTLFAAEVEPQLAVGRNFACLLSANAGGGPNLVRCWDIDGRELATPRLAGVRQLTASEHVACAASATQVHCWPPVLPDSERNIWYRGDAGELNKTFSSRQLSLLRAGSGGEACGWSDAQGLNCYLDKKMNSAQAEAGARMKRSPENFPIGIAMNGHIVCDLSIKGEVHCWGDTALKDEPEVGLVDSVPSDLGPAQEIAMTGARACVIEDDHLRCWGDWDGKSGVRSSPLVAPVSLAMSDDAAFVVDDGKLWQIDSSGELKPAAGRPAELEHLGLVAAMGPQYCTASDEELACHFQDRLRYQDRKDTDFEFRILHGMQVVPAEIGAFDGLLSRMAPNVYPEKKLLLLTAAQFAKPLSPRGKLFVYNALTAVVENADSEYVTKEVQPTWSRLQARFAGRFRLGHPTDFPVTAENSTSALRLTLAAVTSLNGMTPAWQELTLKLGEALATDDSGAIARVLGALEQARPDIATYLDRARSKGQAQLLIDLMQYFRKVK